MKRPVETDEGVRIVPIFGLYVARVAFSSTKLPRCPFCVISRHFPHSSFIRRREPRGLQLLKSGESDAVAIACANSSLSQRWRNALVEWLPKAAVTHWMACDETPWVAPPPPRSSPDGSSSPPSRKQPLGALLVFPPTPYMEPLDEFYAASAFRFCSRLSPLWSAAKWQPMNVRELFPPTPQTS